MNLYFTGKISSKIIMINTAIFKNKNTGDYITIDRDVTEYTINDDGSYNMVWVHCYVWDSDKSDYFIDSDNHHEAPNHNLNINDFYFDHFEIEDDAPEDYKITVDKWNY